MVYVPKNLCANILDSVSDESAAFPEIGSIALQGIRLVQPTLGEVVGVTGLGLSRASFYQKELSFQVSCSYGSGSYDPLYEESGQDYPVSFFRWTEQRNFEAVLDMLVARRLDVSPFVTHQFPIEEAEEAYKVISGVNALGTILTYPQSDDCGDDRLRRRTIPLVQAREAENRRTGPAVVGFLV